MRADGADEEGHHAVHEAGVHGEAEDGGECGESHEDDDSEEESVVGLAEGECGSPAEGCGGGSNEDGGGEEEEIDARKRASSLSC